MIKRACLRLIGRAKSVARLLVGLVIVCVCIGLDAQVLFAQTATPVTASGPLATFTPSGPPTATPPGPPGATPTSAALTPAASAFFAPVYMGANPMARQLDTGLIKGRVLDFDNRGLAGFGVLAVTGDHSFLGFTGRLGEYVLAELPVGYYDVRVDGYEGLPAIGLYVGASSEVTIDFLESTRTGQFTPTLTQTPSSIPTEASLTPTVITSPTRRPADISTVVRGETTPFSSGDSADPIAAVLGIFQDTSKTIRSLHFNRWVESFFLGALLAYVAGVIVVAMVNLRRR